MSQKIALKSEIVVLFVLYEETTASQTVVFYIFRVNYRRLYLKGAVLK